MPLLPLLIVVKSRQLAALGLYAGIRHLGPQAGKGKNPDNTGQTLQLNVTWSSNRPLPGREVLRLEEAVTCLVILLKESRLTCSFLGLRLVIAVTLSRGATGWLKFIGSLPSTSPLTAGFTNRLPKVEKFLPTHFPGCWPHLNTPHNTLGLPDSGLKVWYPTA